MTTRNDVVKLNSLCPALFVTGTDTDVGKTWVTCVIADQASRAGLNVGVCKPVCCGSTVADDGSRYWHDVEALHAAINGRFNRETIAPQCFHEPLAPPVAAAAEDRQVDATLLRSCVQQYRKRVGFLLIEGAGGLLCPVTPTETIADLAHDIGVPLLIVARTGLGTINHTLLTVEVAIQRGLTVAGIVLNDVAGNTDERDVESNTTEIAGRCQIPVLGWIKHHKSELLQGGQPRTIDWLQLAKQHAGQ